MTHSNCMTSPPHHMPFTPCHSWFGHPWWCRWSLHYHHVRRCHRIEAFCKFQWSFPQMEQEFNEFSTFRVSDKSLKHELESISSSCFLHVSCCCCGSILASNTMGDRFDPFYCNDKYFWHWILFSLIQWKHLGKTQRCGFDSDWGQFNFAIFFFNFKNFREMVKFIIGPYEIEISIGPYSQNSKQKQ